LTEFTTAPGSKVDYTVVWQKLARMLSTIWNQSNRVWDYHAVH